MIIDNLENADRYNSLGEGIAAAFSYLRATDLATIATGKHIIEGDNVFAIVQEYDTLDAAGEQMESHRKHIDVQYVVSGTELVGHAVLANQSVSKPYSDEEDFMLYADKPSFFSKFDAGIFMIFYPTDLHMPCISDAGTQRVRKVVVKVRIK